MCVLVFLLMYFLLLTKSKYKITFSALLIGIAVVIGTNMDLILNYFIELMPRIGMSNRVFTSMATNAFISYENSSERDIIIRKLLDAINDSDTFGYGLCGSWNISGGYSHNYILDMIISFGIPVGSLLILLTLCLIAKGFFACSTKEEKGFYILLFCSGFVKLFISSFFLRDYMFWLFLGYCIYVIRQKSLNKQNE